MGAMPTALGGHAFRDMATQSRGHGTQLIISAWSTSDCVRISQPEVPKIQQFYLKLSRHNGPELFSSIAIASPCASPS
jgi:hypothetical protein